MFKFFKSSKYPILILIILNIFLSAYWLLHGDIRYDVDVSRDLLLIKEIATVKPFTLIGSHTSIGGVFHGPAWYYLNVPAFLISSGNPVIIGWFWWGLSICTLIIIFLITQKIFNKKTALLAILLYSANAIINPIYGLKMFFPPYGAVILFPVFFYLFTKYVLTKKLIFLAFAVFILGFIIQFEMAFGLPIFALTMLFLIFFLYKKKLLLHWLVVPIILLPLSTFIIFDLRHNFLQTYSLLQYLGLQVGKHQLSLFILLGEKITGILSDTFFLLTQDNRVFSWIYSILFIFFTIKIKAPNKKIYWLFLYFYLGYWISYLSLKPLWSSYYWPLLPVMIILYSSFVNFISNKTFLLIYIPLLLWNMYIGVSYIKDFNTDVTKRSKNSWAYNKLIAESVFEDAEGDFGYFIFTPERWVFQNWYALDFIQKQYPQKKGYPFLKRKLTYLIVMDSPKDRLDPVSMGWRITDLNIKQEPKEKKIIDVAEIQKYYLTEEEIKSPTNPYLLKPMFFR